MVCMDPLSEWTAARRVGGGDRVRVRNDGEQRFLLEVDAIQMQQAWADNDRMVRDEAFDVGRDCVQLRVKQHSRPGATDHAQTRARASREGDNADQRDWTTTERRRVTRRVTWASRRAKRCESRSPGPFSPGEKPGRAPAPDSIMLAEREGHRTSKAIGPPAIGPPRPSDLRPSDLHVQVANFGEARALEPHSSRVRCIEGRLTSPNGSEAQSLALSLWGRYSPPARTERPVASLDALEAHS